MASKKNDERLEVAGELLSIVASEVISKRLPDIESCRLVSKVWRSVMSTRKFNRQYRKNHPVAIDEYKLAVYDRSDICMFSLGEEIPPPPPGSPFPEVSVLASLDGLLVVAQELVEWPSARLKIYNPLLRRYMELPHLPGLYIFVKSDPVGFYADDDDDADDYNYKLVCLSCYSAGSPYGAFVYSCRSGSWAQLEFSNDQLLDRRSGETLFSWSPPTSWGQCLYFVASSFEYRCCKGRSRIICFNVKTETFSQTPFPHPQDDDASYFAKLAVQDGSLHLYVFHHDTDGLPVKVRVWKVKDDLAAVVDDQAWVQVEVNQPPPSGPHHVCTKYAGDWVAVLDEHENSFKKVDAEDFKARCPWRLQPTFEYRLSRAIYVPSYVDPCPAKPASSLVDPCPANLA